MDFKELVLKSFRITWRHKWLWVFGFFAGGASVTPNWNFNFPNMGGRPAGVDPAITEWVRQNAGVIVGLGAALAVLAILFFALSVIAQAALIGAARDLDDEQDASFGAALTIGLASFWRLLRFVLLVALIFIILIAVLSIPMITAVLSGSHTFFIATAALTILALILVLVPLWVIGAIIVNFGFRRVVLDGEGAIDALKFAWRLFRDKTGLSFSIWAISLGLSVIFFLGLMIIVVALLLPLGLGGFLAFRSDFNPAALGVMVFFALLWLTALAVILSAWRAFLSVYWTLAYRRLTAGNDAGVDAVDGDTL